MLITKWDISWSQTFNRKWIPILSKLIQRYLNESYLKGSLQKLNQNSILKKMAYRSQIIYWSLPQQRSSIRISVYVF